MKTNDQAVSPVIAVILMVAITVVLAATVWVWMSGFTGGGAPPSGSMSLSQTGQLVTDNATAAAACGAGATWCAKWTIVSSSSGLTLERLEVKDGTRDTGAISCTVAGSSASTATIAAGDVLACYGTSTDAAAGDVFQFVDVAANSVMLSLTVR